MARGRLRGSNSSLPKSTPTKRLASPANPLRQSKRIKPESATSKSGIKATSKKSVYFEQSSEPEPEDTASASDVDHSGYEDNEESAAEPDPTSDEYASSEDERPRKRKPAASVRNSLSTRVKAGGELWREGVRSHLEPGQEIIVELPKARPAGKTPYKDATIHSNTLLFLGDLKANNDRAWLKTHDADFRQSERDWKSFVESITEKIIEVDETIPELPVKDVIYRIYRDIRFSPDPTPYKSYFSAAWSRTGRKGPYAVYYLHIQPKGNSFFGGGLWMPNADQLGSLRRTIDRRAGDLKSVLMRDGIRKSFLDNVPRDKNKIVKAFAKSNKENALKKKPKDYDADHPEIELLKLKNFIIGCKLTDEEVISPKFMNRVTSLVRDCEPYVTYLNSVVMPDSVNDDGDDDDDEDEDDEEDNDDGNKSAGDSEHSEIEDEDPGPDPEEREEWEPQ